MVWTGALGLQPKMGLSLGKQYVNPVEYFPGKTIVEAGLDYYPVDDLDLPFGNTGCDGRAYFSMDNGDFLMCTVPYHGCF